MTVTHNAIRQTVADTLQVLLGEPVTIETDVQRDAKPAWDSLKSIEIVLTLEAECGVEFSPEEIAEADSQQKLVALIAAKTGAEWL